MEPNIYTLQCDYVDCQRWFSQFSPFENEPNILNTFDPYTQHLTESQKRSAIVTIRNCHAKHHYHLACMAHDYLKCTQGDDDLVECIECPSFDEQCCAIYFWGSDLTFYTLEEYADTYRQRRQDDRDGVRYSRIPM